MSADLRAKIADRITEADIDSIMEVMRGAMKADTTIRSPRDPGDPTGYLMVPDWTNRIAAARFLWEMRDGKAKQSVDLAIAEAPRPMSRLEAARALMQDWESVRRIGDEHVRLLKEAIPVEQLGAAAPKDAQPAHVEILDVE